MVRFVKFIALVLVISAMVMALLEFLFRNYQTRADQLFKDYYSRIQTVETLYIGNSHIGAFNDVIPDSSQNISNMSIGGQDIFRMYTVIKTVAPKSPQLKKIFMGLDYDLIGYNQVKSGQEYMDRQYYKYTGALYNNTSMNRAMSVSAFFRSNRDMNYLFSKPGNEVKKKDFIPLATVPVATAVAPTASNIVEVKGYDKPTLNNCRKRAEEHTLLKFKTKNIAENLTYLESIVAICRQYHIELILFNPPKTQCYKEYSGKETVVLAKHTIDSFAVANRTPYLDFYSDTSFHDYMFADFDHLNPIGVKMLLPKLGAR